MVSASEKMKPRCRCGPRVTVCRHLGQRFTDSVRKMPCETKHASSNCFADTRLCDRNISSISMTNVFAVVVWPLRFSSVTLTRPSAKSQQHFRTCWKDITYAPYTATVYLWMLTGSMFCAHRNTKSAGALFFTCPFVLSGHLPTEAAPALHDRHW
jgi:hypothetical protein